MEEDKTLGKGAMSAGYHAKEASGSLTRGSKRGPRRPRQYQLAAPGRLPAPHQVGQEPNTFHPSAFVENGAAQGHIAKVVEALPWATVG